MNESEINEWFALDHNDGTFPPGRWACAGQWREEYGVFLGLDDLTLGFIPEECINDAIADLKREGEADIAGMVARLRADVAALRTGKQRLARDLAGRRIRYDGRKEKKQ